MCSYHAHKRGIGRSLWAWSTRARSLHCDPDPAHISDDLRGSCWAWLVKFRCVAKIEAYFFYLVFSGAKVHTVPSFSRQENEIAWPRQYPDRL